MRSKLH